MTIAICDDEKFFRETIINYLLTFQIEANDISVFEFENGENLISAYKKGKKFDIVFLDIEMDGITGIEVGKQIREFEKNVIFIFTTSHTEYISDAFRLNAFQFLVKPINQEDFNNEMKRAINTINQNKKKYIIKSDNKIEVIEICDIIYIEIFGRKLVVHTVKKNFEITGRLKDEFDKLKSFGFIRCHKSIFVNMDYIQSIENKSIVLTSNNAIALSRNYKSDVLRSFNFYLSGCAL